MCKKKNKQEMLLKNRCSNYNAHSVAKNNTKKFCLPEKNKNMYIIKIAKNALHKFHEKLLLFIGPGDEIKI